MEFTLIDKGESRVCAIEQPGTVLDALGELGISIPAACGGRGTCGKCRVLVRDETGSRYRLACQVPLAEGMEVVVAESGSMEVSMDGIETPWHADGSEEGLGIAIDVGTTTVVCRLYDLESGKCLAAAGRANPQATFGADVISRITACSRGLRTTMCNLLSASLGDMIDDVLARAGADAARIARVVLVGNTVMESIAGDVDPEPIGVVPFIPLTLFGEEAELGCLAERGITGGKAWFAPCIAGYVGGDVTGDLLAIDIRHRDKLVIVLDLGTNGEMALGDSQAVVACATAAGPVFEGANITHGMPAYPGAISRVQLEGDDVAFTTIDGKPPVGVCGTGLIDAVAVLLRAGVVDETGYMLDADEALDEGVSPALAARIFDYRGANAFRLAGDIAITQKDVRSLQLAKSAVCGGVRTMLDHRGVTTAEVSELLIAGGFGEYLNRENAARVGLFPSELVDRTRSIGNAAIEGAGAALLSGAAREEAQAIADGCEYLELSTNALFNDYYVDSMTFPEE